MILQAEPGNTRRRGYNKKRLKALRKQKCLITMAGGKLLTNAYAKKLSKEKNVHYSSAGRYEGIDARVKKSA